METMQDSTWSLSPVLVAWRGGGRPVPPTTSAPGQSLGQDGAVEPKRKEDSGPTWFPGEGENLKLPLPLPNRVSI